MARVSTNTEALQVSQHEIYVLVVTFPYLFTRNIFAPLQPIFWNKKAAFAIRCYFF